MANAAEIRNPAFMRMTARDTFWAAETVMRFTREELEAIVASGEYTNPDNPVYFLDVFPSANENAAASASTPSTQSEATSQPGTLELLESDGKFLRAEIRSLNEDYPYWSTAIGVYLRSKGSSYEIVAIDRESRQASTFPIN